MSDLPLIVFDVNETLLDLETMAPTFERIFDDKSAMRLWFANLIMYSAALTVAEQYVPFTDIGAAVMKMLADTRGITIRDSDMKELTEKFSTMPPEAYAYVQKELQATPPQLCLIACHTWDTLGAVAAGWEAALIRRSGNDVLGVGPQPHIIGDDLDDVADQLIARHVTKQPLARQ